MKINETKDFYNSLATKQVQRSFLGIDSRFGIEKITKSRHIKSVFEGLVGPHINSSSRVLDFGCGTGAFSILGALYSSSVEGVDISEGLLSCASEYLDENPISNLAFTKIDGEKIPFRDDEFDAILLLDTIHHLENPDKLIPELMRVLKPGGKIICFEPNKLNPLIYLIHYIDPNERGLLRMGTRNYYKKLFSSFASESDFEFLPLVIGPNIERFEWILRILNGKYMGKILSWLNPKIGFIYKKY